MRVTERLIALTLDLSQMKPFSESTVISGIHEIPVTSI